MDEYANTLDSRLPTNAQTVDRPLRADRLLQTRLLLLIVLDDAKNTDPFSISMFTIRRSFFAQVTTVSLPSPVLASSKHILLLRTFQSLARMFRAALKQ